MSLHPCPTHSTTVCQFLGRLVNESDGQSASQRPAAASPKRPDVADTKQLRKFVHRRRTPDKGPSAPNKPSDRHEFSFVTTKIQDQKSTDPSDAFTPPLAVLDKDATCQGNNEGDLNCSPSQADSVEPSVDPFAKWSPLDPDPLGLCLVHTHPDPRGDVVFVHGLGGTAFKTWSWGKNIHNFWPVWLADEDGFSDHRIFTYGYNANFKGDGTILNTIDFAKDLLVQLLVHRHGAREDEMIFGQRPLIFVAHSMGGLVVKKAFVLGQHDERYAHIISKTLGIMFLATPHKGSQYAKLLNSILSCSLGSVPPKGYVEDLEKNSRAIQDINEHFRISCGSVSLVSLYETSKTSFGLAKSIVVEKESATLGYPLEISSPLNADHHSVCKFKSKDDPNYITVTGLLKLWVSTTHEKQSQTSFCQESNVSNSLSGETTIEKIMGIRDEIGYDFRSLRIKAMNGTCDWITKRASFSQWLNTTLPSQSPSIFWLMGLPAMGKTMLATHVIQHIQDRTPHNNCQFHYFLGNHQDKRTISYCLRSIASQLALANEEFRAKLVHLHKETGISFNSQEQHYNVVWEKVFEDIIFKLRTKPMYLILDALDEADHPTPLINHLVKIQSSTQIRIFVTSRPMRIPSGHITGNLPIYIYFVSENDTSCDIKSYVQAAVDEILPDSQIQLRKEVVMQVVSKANGSFLWVRLALEDLRENWHTHEDIHRALTGIPSGMGSFYTRMLGKIMAQNSRIRLIAERILTWVTLSWRSLSIAELQTALEPDFSDFVDLPDTITQICGNFVSIDNKKVSLIHITARQFLLEGLQGSSPPFINSESGHECIALMCLRYLSNRKWKRMLKRIETSSETVSTLARTTDWLLLAEKDYPLLAYSVCYYAYHVSKSSLLSENLIKDLTLFFSQYCLYWIEAIALTQNLRYLTRSARDLKAYAERLSHRPKDNLQDLPKDTNSDDSQFVRSWANDYLRIAGKFGSNLLQSPGSIHWLIPAFCPIGSMIGSVYGVQERAISLTGMCSEAWDDCVACVSLGSEEGASQILATGTFFLALIGIDSVVIVWNAETFEEVRRIQHDDEYILSMALSRSQNLLVTAGFETYRVWDIATGRELYRLKRTSQALTMFVVFGKFDDELIVGLDDCSVTSFDLTTSQPKWRFIPPSSREFYGCPLIFTLSPCLTKLAVAWRGKAPIVWVIHGGNEQHPIRCPIKSSADPVVSPRTIIWQADANSMLVLCQSTALKEWHLYDEDLREFPHVQAQKIQISRDGTFLISSDYTGTVSIYTFPRLGLIYKLANKNAFIQGLAFSPDAQRFYELRDTLCNVWEPDALVRPDETEIEDHGSSIMAEIVVAHDESSQDLITALANGFGDRFYCVGKEDGTVSVHDSTTGDRFRKVSTHASRSSILNLTWSPSGRFLISGDDSGRLLAKRLDQKKDGTFAVFPVFDIRITEPIRQFVFSTKEKRLLISTTSTDRIWDLKTKAEICNRAWGFDSGSRWTQHPFQPELLMAVYPSDIRNYTWDGLEPSDGPTNSSEEPLSSQSSTQLHGKTVHWVAQTDDKKYLVYLSGTGSSDTRLASGVHLEILTLSDLQIRQPRSLTGECLSEVAKQIKFIMGTYKDQLAFLDHDFWLCTWKIEATSQVVVKRHYFLPRDWLNPGTLRMATLSPEGTLFCPKLGHVAVVKNGIRL